MASCCDVYDFPSDIRPCPSAEALRYGCEILLSLDDEFLTFFKALTRLHAPSGFIEIGLDQIPVDIPLEYGDLASKHS